MKIEPILTITFGVLAMVLGIICYNSDIENNKLNSSMNRMSVAQHRQIVDLKYEHEKQLQLKDAEVNRLNLALDSAFKDNAIIQTLLNKNMEDWTVEGILKMREKLDSLPYGSWFEGGHYVTGAFGSHLLTGTYWGKNGHRGVDTKPNSGNPYEIIISPIAGKVITWGRNDRLFGNYLVIESLDGMFQIKLAHLSSIAIFEPDGKYDLYEGMEFPAGSRIARMGATGRVTGAHLHTEYYIRENDSWRLLNASAILDYMGE